MLIKALCDYYETLALQGKVIPDGFSEIGVSYQIYLEGSGKISSILDCRDEIEAAGKIKRIPHTTKIIKRLETTTICSNYIEHRGLYIFGLNYDAKTKSLTPVDSKDAAKKKHEAFVKTNLDFIEDLDSPLVNAFKSFLKNWNPESETENPLLLSMGKDVNTANFIFCLSGQPGVFLHEDSSVLEKWDSIFWKSQNTIGDKNIRQCAVFGENLEIARLHNKISGIIGGQASGTVLTCFKNDSEGSYGMTESFNSNVSIRAMEQYTEALNYLVASKNNHQTIDDTTVIYWAQSGDNNADDLMGMLTFGSNNESKIDDDDLSSLVEDCRNGAITWEKLTKFTELDLNTDYYFVGLKPNSARLSLKFIYKKELGSFLLNAAQHQADLKIIGLNKVVPLWRLKSELISPKSQNEAVNPALIAKVFESILNGIPYPEELLQKVIQRVRTDTDNEISPVRAGIIKAYINRKNRFNKKEEEISMALDKENTNQAYLCGRLFAVLEKIQQKASGYSLDRTIKDSYFASAAARPATVFPKIIKLSTYHLSKLGNPKYFRDDLSEITEKLGNEFPKTLSLTEQGKFILGYYHQTNNNNKNTEDM